MSDMDIRFYLSILLRRLPYIVAIAVPVFLVAVIATRFLPPRFDAGAKILVETPEMPKELAVSTVPIAPVEQLQILQQQLTTRSALMELARKLDLYSERDLKANEEDIVQDLRSRIGFDQVQLNTQSTVPGATVFELSFTANTPDVAAKVTNELVAMLLVMNQRQRTDRAGSTLQFFDQEVARLDADLKLIEANIMAFKKTHRDTLPESLDFRRSEQANLQQRLVSIDREESDLRSRRNTLIATYAGAGQVPGAAPVSPEQQMLADLNRALVEQLATFKEDSPNIVAIRARIAKLQKSLVVETPAYDEKKDNATSRASSFGLDLQLSDIDDRLRAIGRERKTIGESIAALTKSIAETPASELIQSSLERNRENIQTQYNAAISRRAAASTGEQIEMRSDGGRFTLLEKATPPNRPVSSKRKLLVIGGALGGIGLGLAFVVLLELLNKTVRRPKDLEQLLKTPPLGTIPTLRTKTEVRAAAAQRRRAAFVSAGMVPASLILIHYFFIPLDTAFFKLASSIGLARVI